MVLPVLTAAFIFGTIVGSFANVFVLRYNTGRSLGGRSGCATCGKKLGWYELIPVVSFLVQRGRCRTCSTAISFQYPIVELTMGFLFSIAAYSALVATPTPNYLYLIYALLSIFLLVSISVYDLKHMIIPDGMVYAFIFVSFFYFIATSPSSPILVHVVAILRTLFVPLPLFLLWAVSQGRWMGFGDVKLAVGIGFMLGILPGLSALVFSVWIGAIISLLLIGYARLKRSQSLAPNASHLTIQSEIPFGPFLVVGTLFVLFTHITLLDLVSRL